MDVVMSPVGSLRRWPTNPRENEDAVRFVANSIKQFGFRQPIVVDADWFIIAGHTRLDAALSLGLTEVTVHVAVDMSPEQAAAYRLADNKTAEFASWDADLLGAELRALASEFDFLDFGFSAKDLAAVNATDADADVPLSEATALADKWGCERGKLWSIGGHRLLCGDSTNPADVERLLDGASPGIMVTDPPYGVAYEPKWRHDAGLNQSHRVGTVANDDRFDWTEVYRLFAGDVAYVWHAGRFSAEIETHLRNAGLSPLAQIIWRKKALIVSRGHYHWQHEPCWYAVREGQPSGYVGGDQSTVWAIDNVARVETTTEHGTQKPLECMARPIRNHECSARGVFEPFAGSGTTLVASNNLGRRCYAMELDAFYCGVIIERMVRAFPGIEVKVVEPNEPKPEKPASKPAKRKAGKAKS